MQLKLKSAEVIIIGAGPAGLFAAIHCKGRKVIVLEKNATPGRKLLISGTGRCNITHDCKLSEFFSHYGENQRFLKTALHAFTNNDLIGFLNRNGLETVTDKNGKVFPASQKAEDVLKVILEASRKIKLDIRYKEAVQKIEKTSDGFRIETNEELYTSKFIVITTGGMSYPATGSTGDGYHMAKELGHSVVPPKPSLSSVFVRDYRFSSISGVSVQDKEIYLYRNNKKMKELRGDIGFTHKGLSGPGILDFSRFIMADDALRINFSGLNPDEFRDNLIKASEYEGKTAIQTFMKKFFLPRSLMLLILESKSIDPETRLAEITKPQRTQLVEAFCEFPFVVEKVGGFNMAMVTAGGVKLDEVNPKIMESRLVPGLYFAGEVLDIDGDTGGYNLQAAFSTGYLAGKSISEINNL